MVLLSVKTNINSFNSSDMILHPLIFPEHFNKSVISKYYLLSNPNGSYSCKVKKQGRKKKKRDIILNKSDCYFEQVIKKNKFIRKKGLIL